MRIWAVCMVAVLFGSDAASCGADVHLPEREDDLQTWVELATLAADVIVNGVVARVETLSPEGQTFTFMSVVPDTFLKGWCTADTVTFALWGFPPSVRWSHSRIEIGDTLIAWTECDGRGELFNRRTLAVKRGNLAWTEVGDIFTPLSAKLDTFETWIRASVAERSLEHLATTSGAVGVVFVDAIRYHKSQDGPQIVADVRVEEPLFGLTAGDSLHVHLRPRGCGYVRDCIIAQPGQRFLFFLNALGGIEYGLNGGRDAAYVYYNRERLVPPETTPGPYPGLPCGKCGRATRCQGKRRITLAEVAEMISVRQKGATSN
jgi:hypothetical protein